jgi:hypothetical protein
MPYGDAVTTVTLNMPTDAGWLASSAQISSSSPLALLTLEQGNYSQRVRLDLDKRIAIDPVAPGMTPSFVLSVVARLTSERARLLGR